jgi:hypothetical protein
MGALLALAFDFAVAHQAVEPRAGLAVIGSLDQPRDSRAGEPHPSRHHLHDLRLSPACLHTLRGAVRRFAQSQHAGAAGKPLADVRTHQLRAARFHFCLCRRSGDLFFQFDAGLSNLRRHPRTVLNLHEDTLGLLAIARGSFLHFLGNE